MSTFHRKIETVEQLNRLRAGAVVIDDNGFVAERIDTHPFFPECRWVLAGDDSTYQDADLALPVRILLEASDR